MTSKNGREIISGDIPYEVPVCLYLGFLRVYIWGDCVYIWGTCVFIYEVPVCLYAYLPKHVSTPLSDMLLLYACKQVW